ncbi:hypothetical protein [Bacillus amyloliquefaciens]|uniref:hypothetical protein n=1 Tax=Bacillus amyloliquefaciens TaxID=1390 RepID=UPI00210CCF87|nr:hypothetical protein [Bacillus amyloliquefaciens]UUA78624.1 hypothetical protein NO220_08600 [Bacillus amyloliquefaciens]
MKEFKINLSKGEILYTGSYICTLSKTAASTPEQISLEAAAEKLAEELIMQQAMNREHQRQQDIAANQFRQAQKDIKLLQAENKRYRNALEFYADDTTYTNEFEDCPPAIDMDWGAVAKTALEGAAE